MAEYIIEFPDNITLQEAPPFHYVGKIIRCKDCARGVYEHENGFHAHVWCRAQCHPDYWYCADGIPKEKRRVKK